MARFKPYNPDQSRLVPITLSEHIYEGSLEEAIHKIVEERIEDPAFNGLVPVRCRPTGQPNGRLADRVIGSAYAIYYFVNNC